MTGGRWPGVTAAVLRPTLTSSGKPWEAVPGPLHGPGELGGVWGISMYRQHPGLWGLSRSRLRGEGQDIVEVWGTVRMRTGPGWSREGRY